MNGSPVYVCIWMGVRNVLIFDVSKVDFPLKSTPNICCIWKKSYLFHRFKWISIEILWIYWNYWFLYLIDLNLTLGEGSLAGARRFTVGLRSLGGSWNDWICVLKVFAFSRTLSQYLHWKFNEWLLIKWFFNVAILLKLKIKMQNTNCHVTLNSTITILSYYTKTYFVFHLSLHKSQIYKHLFGPHLTLV